MQALYTTVIVRIQALRVVLLRICISMYIVKIPLLSTFKMLQNFTKKHDMCVQSERQAENARADEKKKYI